jgi:hypothetical protein
MPPRNRKTRSHLFTVRVWSEEMGDGSAEWRGKAQCVGTGEILYFRDWKTMTEFFVETLDADSSFTSMEHQEQLQGGR